MTKKARKEVERVAYCERVQGALQEARRAGQAAGEAFIQQAPKAPDGFVDDEAGSAWVQVRAPSSRFRTALTDLGEIERGKAGAWIISNFTRDLRTQSKQAHRVAAQAACKVLLDAFPEEPNIAVYSFMD